MTSDRRTECQPVQKCNDPKPQRTLTEDGIRELISFFQLLRKWDREAKAFESCKKTENDVHGENLVRVISVTAQNSKQIGLSIKCEAKGKMPQDYSFLPTWIPEQLKRVDLTPEQLAHRAGINRISVYRYISDADRPSKETMLKICSALNISAEEGLRQYTPKKNGRPRVSEGSKQIDTYEPEVSGRTVRPRISMDVRGRFGQLFAAAVNKRGISLRQVAAKFDYSYEQMRKLVQGRSHPSEELLHALCRYLDLDFDEALKAANADRIEQRYGTNEAYATIGKSPRLADIEPYLSQLSDSEWQMFVTQIAGYVRQRHRND